MEPVVFVAVWQAVSHRIIVIDNIPYLLCADIALAGVKYLRCGRECTVCVYFFFARCKMIYKADPASSWMRRYLTGQDLSVCIPDLSVFKMQCFYIKFYKLRAACLAYAAGTDRTAGTVIPITFY